MIMKLSVKNIFFGRWYIDKMKTGNNLGRLENLVN